MNLQDAKAMISGGLSGCQFKILWAVVHSIAFGGVFPNTIAAIPGSITPEFNSGTHFWTKLLLLSADAEKG